MLQTSKQGKQFFNKSFIFISFIALWASSLKSYVLRMPPPKKMACSTYSRNELGTPKVTFPVICLLEKVGSTQSCIFMIAAGVPFLTAPTTLHRLITKENLLQISQGDSRAALGSRVALAPVLLSLIVLSTTILLPMMMIAHLKRYQMP